MVREDNTVFWRMGRFLKKDPAEMRQAVYDYLQDNHDIIMDVGSQVLKAVDVDVNYYIDLVSHTGNLPPEITLYAMSHLCDVQVNVLLYNSTVWTPNIVSPEDINLREGVTFLFLGDG